MFSKIKVCLVLFVFWFYNFSSWLFDKLAIKCLGAAARAALCICMFDCKGVGFPEPGGPQETS